jgi:hypothetical protein
LTAAHCTTVLGPSELLFIDVGDYDLRTTAETPSALVPSDRIINHPQYNTQFNNNDIYLVRLKIPITFSAMVAPTCLPFNLKGQALNNSKVLEIFCEI